ncbi:MAG TPA: DUF2970 domain-containing protein [Burkholderiaceae bacterium]|nr:DUF2970 domain-containing protein [Burkholderiaceae bacterium]
MTSPRPRASFGRTLQAVLWSFFGVRKGRDHDADMQNLNPVHVIVVGIGAAAVFVFVLIMIVRWVVKG